MIVHDCLIHEELDSSMVIRILKFFLSAIRPVATAEFVVTTRYYVEPSYTTQKIRNLSMVAG